MDMEVDEAIDMEVMSMAIDVVDGMAIVDVDPDPIIILPQCLL
jgi:hypothetical protein